MNSIKGKSNSSRGGKRPGSGRPKGSKDPATREQGFATMQAAANIRKEPRQNALIVF